MYLGSLSNKVPSENETHYLGPCFQKISGRTGYDFASAKKMVLVHSLLSWIQGKMEEKKVSFN